MSRHPSWLLLTVIGALLLCGSAALASPTIMIDNMENLANWHTGGQKEASLRPEHTLVTQGRQALRFTVVVNFETDETVQGKKYPKGWPRIERNPKPPLDLSMVGGIAFDIYTQSSRSAMPGSSLHIILRDQSGASWQSNLGQLPLNQWKHFHLDFGSFKRNRIVHWEFFLAEADYNDHDRVSFVIDNVQGYAAQKSRQLLPQLQARLTALNSLAGPRPPAAYAARVRQLRADILAALRRGQQVDRMDLATSNAFDGQCQALLTRLADTLMLVGAARTVSDGSYCVGTETSLQKVLRDDTDFIPGRELKLAVAGNEREAGQILVRALRADIPSLTADWTALAGPGGATIPRDRISLRAVGYVQMQKSHYGSTVGSWWPDPLLPLDWPGSGKKGLGPLATAFAHVGETQPLWLTVKCPADTPAGEYHGTVKLQPRGLPATTVNLNVKVWGFSLPLQPRLKTAFSFSPNDFTRFFKLKAMTEAQRHYCEAFLLAHKTNPMLLYTPYAWPGLEDLDFMAKRGLNAYCLGYCPQKVADFGKVVYYHWLRDQRAWLARQGWDREAWLYGYDEPHCRPDFATLKGVMREVYGMVQAAAPGMPRASTTPIIPDLYGAVTLWIPQTQSLVRQDTLARQQAGDQVWTYVACTPPHPFANFFIDYPALDQRLLFWQTWQQHCTGFLYYATDLWRANYEGQNQRWPDIPWNSRPVKDFEFNGDGILLYPGPGATLLSSVRQEVITDGIEDYDYLSLLHDAVAQLKQHPGNHGALLQAAEGALTVPADISTSLTQFSHDPQHLLARRELIGDLLQRLRAALPAASWRQVMTGSSPLSPPAPKSADTTPLPLPFKCDFEQPGGMQPWVGGGQGGLSAVRKAAPGADGKLAAVSTGAGHGWADWESPFLKVKSGQRYAVRLSVKADLKAGEVRLFLFKYGPGGLPLDLATRPNGAFGPALLGAIQSNGEWQKRRFLATVPPGVDSVRLYLQCFGIEGTAAFDDISVAPAVVDPNLVDDMDEIGGWQPGFPEAHVSRETKIVHQGNAALNFTVKVNWEGGEAKYPIGWPHLQWRPSPPLNWTGKQALTFWVYATSSRAALPPHAVYFSVRSKGGGGLSVPLTFPLGKWTKVTVPLAGKKLSAVNQIQFFVAEADYHDKDQVTFIIDDMRLTP